MTQAVTVRRDGDTFQARLFWWHAARLLDPGSPIIRVGFENGPKSFDDIWVEYDPKRSAQDQYGAPLRREHVQCKWHVSPDTYGYSHLIDPEFINANTRSLLQRARDAQLAYAPDGIGVRFKLLTNWRLDRADPLRQMIGTRSGAIRLERLYGSATDNSKAGAVRKAWRDHLGLDEEELRVLARTLAFGEATDTLDGLRDNLDVLFAYVGLRRIPRNESAFPYDDVVFQWMAQDRLEFDRKSFPAICDRDGLLGQGEGRRHVYGVKSFEHPIDRLEERCHQVLDLIPAFDERYIRSEADWGDALYPALRAFLLSAARDQSKLRLALDAHATLAFAAGSVLNIKSGRHVELEQRTTGERIWAADDFPPDVNWASLEAEVVELDPQRPDLAIAVSLTHDIAPDVRRYLSATVPTVGRLLMLTPSTGPGAQSVACGRHAFELAEAATRMVREARGSSPVAAVHLFVAAPNGFTFFLGQRQPVLGPVRLYEFDFEGGRDRSYTPSLTLPISTRTGDPV
ncbi:SAVED domain-containing protein [Microvirga mediterraneensis]|uniref:SAVED domain-containing protein n=1 Tax=Microvirga mediterraneensis TaxID=2754695 RepID=A0A838BV40_9HYPH|nr:SAVED domain-containing protein [Microvirga mediterraneensis]MBA1159218.1 SAVED domain-containing protein [Microvirga mediterraneensis]